MLSITNNGKQVGEESFSIQSNYLGTPEVMYDADGKVVWGAELSSYGDVRNLTGERTDCPFRYQGQYEDKETGLYYNRFRYYSTEEGMYICQDPISLAGGTPNLYGYVKDLNSWIDEYGLACEKYRKRTKAQVARLRKNFNNRMRSRFLKKLAKDEKRIKDIGMSDADVARMRKGEVPDNYVVHHKKPLYRGGNNSYDNLDVVKKSDHEKNYSILHNYPEGGNPYGAKYN